LTVVGRKICMKISADRWFRETSATTRRDDVGGITGELGWGHNARYRLLALALLLASLATESDRARVLVGRRIPTLMRQSWPRLGPAGSISYRPTGRHHMRVDRYRRGPTGL
jgi:hypothetical protein